MGLADVVTDNRISGRTGQAPSPLSIAVIDTNPLLADGISALLTKDPGFDARSFTLAGGVEAGLDVILIDPAQFEAAPQDLARDLGKFGTAMVAYSGGLTGNLARNCIAAGFLGVLPKTASFDVMKAALITAAHGGLFIEASFSAAIAQRLGHEDPPKPADDTCLSERELFVLKSVAHGKTMKEIGKELALSAKTVETYKARGTSKLNLTGRRQIVEFAITQGWVESPAGSAV